MSAAMAAWGATAMSESPRPDLDIWEVDSDGVNPIQITFGDLRGERRQTVSERDLDDNQRALWDAWLHDHRRES